MLRVCLRLAEEAVGKKTYCFQSYNATPKTAWIATRADWVSFHKCAVWRQNLMEATRLCVKGSAPHHIARALKEYKSLSWEYESIFFDSLQLNRLKTPFSARSKVGQFEFDLAIGPKWGVFFHRACIRTIIVSRFLFHKRGPHVLVPRAVHERRTSASTT